MIFSNFVHRSSYISSSEIIKTQTIMAYFCIKDVTKSVSNLSRLPVVNREICSTRKASDEEEIEDE